MAHDGRKPELVAWARHNLETLARHGCTRPAPPVDLLVLRDPRSAQPHEPDVRALPRLAVLADISVAGNRATADYLITSPLMAAGPTADPWRADLLALTADRG